MSKGSTDLERFNSFFREGNVGMSILLQIQKVQNQTRGAVAPRYFPSQRRMNN